MYSAGLDLKSATPRQISEAVSSTRRTFLRTVAGMGAATSVFGPGPLRAATTRKGRKTVVVTFGGGARDDETFSQDGQENIPHLLNELAPQGTFFSQVVNRGILGHYVATASLATGMFISTLVRTQQQAMQASFFFVMPNILLSGFMFPRAAMPLLFQWIGLALPLTYFLKVLRGILLKGVGVPALWPQIVILAGFAAGLIALAVQRFHKTLD